MTFHEKSAWVMLVALSLAGGLYFACVAFISAGIGHLPAPNVPFLFLYTALVVVIAIAGHVVVALFALKEANLPPDERERRIFDRAGNLSGYVFGAGVLASLGLYLYAPDGTLLFYAVFASLMLGQLAEYVVQIVLYRRGV